MKRLIIYLAILIALPIGVKAQIDYPIGHPVFHDDSTYATKGDVRLIVRQLYDSLYEGQLVMLFNAYGTK